MKIHFILHETFEAPGAYLTWAKSRGHEITFTKVYEFEKLPDSSKEYNMLIVMGGPQDPIENKDKYPYYNPKEEIDFIKKFIKENKIIIGICLGSQLLGEAYGVKFEHSPYREIGNFPIYLNEESLKDKNIKHFGKKLIVGHWHNDMPGLTKNSIILAESEACPRQIVKYSDKHYGFQCHLEFSKKEIKLLIDSENNLEEESKNSLYVQNSKELLDYDYSEMNDMLFAFLDNIVANEK